MENIYVKEPNNLKPHVLICGGECLFVMKKLTHVIQTINLI